VIGTINMQHSGDTPTSFPVTDSTATYTYGASGNTQALAYGTVPFLNVNENFTASYVSGPHAFKVGYSELQARGSQSNLFPNANGANGVPNGVSMQMECQTITTTTGALYPTGLLDAAGLPTTAYEISGKTGTLAAPAIASTTVNGLPCTSTATATQALLPYQLTENLAPYFYSNKEEDHAAFAQDQWRIKRLTLNLGLRFDWFQAGDPEQTVAAQPQYGLPAKSYAAENSVVDWKDLNPRIGAAYDLFGNGKTAIKASLSRGVITEGNTGIAELTNPDFALINSTTRKFTDYSGTFNPTLDGANFTTAAASGVNGALGAANTAGFYSQSNASSVSYANDVTHGWETRPNDWMLSASVEHEITNGIADVFLLPNLVRQSASGAEHGDSSDGIRPVLHHSASKHRVCRIWRNAIVQPLRPATSIPR